MTETSSALESRVLALESKRYRCPKGISVDDSMRRARKHVERLGLYSANWKWVPEPYYNWSLQKRASLLGAKSTHMLCKSLLLENKKVPDLVTSTNPRYILVVIQYETTLNVQKLTTSLRQLLPVEKRLDERHYDFQVASADDNDRITGYAFNSVTPFGLLENVMIVLSKEIVPYGYFWMGGGHIHLKLGMSVVDFVKMGFVKIMDVSDPRKSE
jgi:prolyl-tRNA editing enzyme YbaK/EbsC (Cys-tRNA(Pro) deacylase)